MEVEINAKKGNKHPIVEVYYTSSFEADELVCIKIFLRKKKKEDALLL